MTDRPMVFMRFNVTYVERDGSECTEVVEGDFHLEAVPTLIELAAGIKKFYRCPLPQSRIQFGSPALGMPGPPDFPLR